MQYQSQRINPTFEYFDKNGVRLSIGDPVMWDDLITKKPKMGTVRLLLKVMAIKEFESEETAFEECEEFIQSGGAQQMLENAMNNGLEGLPSAEIKGEDGLIYGIDCKDVIKLNTSPIPLTNNPL